MTRLLVLLALLTTAAAVVIVALPGSADAADLYVTPSGGGTTCQADRPCGSLDAAYRAAQPGDVVEVGGGSYGRQVVPALGKAAPAVEFRAAEGARVVISGLDIKADHVVLRGMRSDSYLDVDSSASDPVEDVRLIDMHTKTHWINNARDFTWTRGSIGPSFNVKASMVGGQPASQRLTYDGIYWHDATRDDQGVHMECFYVASVQGITIRNSRFRNCAVFDVLFTKIGGDADPSNVLIENTVFERSKDVGGGDAYYTFMVHENATIDGFVLRNNLWELGFSVLGRVTNARAVGNIGRGSCQPGVTYSHNVFAGSRCGSTDKVVGSIFSQFVDPAGGDWRLEANAAAVDAGDPRDFPQLDALGYQRPAGGAPDAGPYEFGAGPPDGDRPAGQVTPLPPGKTAKRSRARVLGVVDGRTLRVRMRSGKSRKVRLLGVKVSGARRCGGASPASRLRRLAPRGSRVTLQTDPRVAGRKPMLAYVSRSRRDLGRVMIARGWARLSGARRISRLAAYKTAQRKASRRNLGLWRCR